MKYIQIILQSIAHCISTRSVQAGKTLKLQQGGTPAYWRHISLVSDSIGEPRTLQLYSTQVLALIENINIYML